MGGYQEDCQDGLEAKRFSPGDVVKGRFLDGDWYLASVDQDNGDGTCTVSWLDGDPADRIKPTAELMPMRFNRERQCYEEGLPETPAVAAGALMKDGTRKGRTIAGAPAREDLAPEEAVAEAGAAAEREREAAQLLADATRQLDADEPAECVRQAEAALAICRELGKRGCIGAADALRLLIAARCALPEPESTGPAEPGEAALKLAAEELAKFKRLGDRRGEASMLLAAAKVNLMTNQQIAAQMATQAASLLKEAGDKVLEAQALSLLCQAQFMLGNAQAALAAADASLELHEVMDDKRGRAEVLHWSARALRALDKLEDGILRARRAVECFRKTGKRKLEASELHSIAEWCLADGNAKKALPAAEQALAICRQEHFSDWEARALSTFCDALVQLKLFKRAWSFVEAAQARFREAGDRRAQATACGVMRRLHLAQGAHDQAMATIEDERKVLAELGDKTGEIRLMHDTADAFIKARSSGKALEALRQALEMAREAEDLEEEVSALRAINNLCVQTDAFLEALKAAHAERSLHQRSGNQREEANACIAVASAQFGLKDRTSALAAACEAQELFHEVGDSLGECRALQLITRVQSAKQTTREALDAAEERLLVVRELKDTQLEAEALQELATLQLNAANTTEAERLCREAYAVQKRAKRLEGEVEAALLLVQVLEAGASESTSKATAARALGVANQALAISGKCKNKIIKGRTLFWHAKMLYWNESFEDSLREAEGAALTFRKLADAPERAAAGGEPGAELRELRQEEAKALILCALLHGLFEQPEKGLKLLERALGLARSCKDEVLEREAGEAMGRVRGEQNLLKPEEIPEEVD